MGVRRRSHSYSASAVGFVLMLMLMVSLGCESSFRRIDRRVDELMTLTSTQLGSHEYSPTIQPIHERWSPAPPRDVTAEQISTVDPPADALTYTSREQETAEVMERLRQYGDLTENVTSMSMSQAVDYAMDHSREFRFAQEEYILTALRLLVERHRWGPRFFNETSALVVGDGDDGMYDTSLQLVNEFRVTQRLPYGGDVSARALARATEDLHQRVAGENVQSAELILSAEVPLLRGAGIVAREDRIQAERDVIYAARSFARFQRIFVFEVVQDYLDLIVAQRGIDNLERQVESLLEAEQRELTLYQQGRSNRFDAALAEQARLAAEDNLNSAMESYRLSVDRFKVRIGYPVEQTLIIKPSQLGLPLPDVSVEDAVAAALTYRLDLQTERDRVDDSQRRVLNAENGLLPDLNLTGSISVPTDDEQDRGGVDFDFEDQDFVAGITFGLPLDREIERLNVRTAQINLERAVRDYELSRDNVAVDAAAAVRQIYRARFSLDIQQKNVEIAQQRIASIEADPDRATARDRTDAVNDMLSARDARDRAQRDLQLAILGYLLTSGQLRVRPDGSIVPLRGMTISSEMVETDDLMESYVP